MPGLTTPSAVGSVDPVLTLGRMPLGRVDVRRLHARGEADGVVLPGLLLSPLTVPGEAVASHHLSERGVVGWATG